MTRARMRKAVRKFPLCLLNNQINEALQVVTNKRTRQRLGDRIRRRDGEIE